MKELYGEGVASHTGSKSCGGGRNAIAEALTGVRAGRVLSREMCTKKIGVPTSSSEMEGNTGHIVSARYVQIPRGRRPRARTEAPCMGTGRSSVWPQKMVARSAL